MDWLTVQGAVAINGRTGSSRKTPGNGASQAMTDEKRGTAATLTIGVIALLESRLEPFQEDE